MESFLFFKPFNKLPFGSRESDVRGLPFFRGALAMKIENAVFPVAQIRLNRVPAITQRTMRNMSDGQAAGRMLALGRL